MYTRVSALAISVLAAGGSDSGKNIADGPLLNIGACELSL